MFIQKLRTEISYNLQFDKLYDIVNSIKSICNISTPNLDIFFPKSHPALVIFHAISINENMVINGPIQVIRKIYVIHTCMIENFDVGVGNIS